MRISDWSSDVCSSDLLADSLCFIIRDPVIHYSTPPPRLVCCCVRHDCILGSVVSARISLPSRNPQGTKVLNAAVVVNRSTDVGQRKTPPDQIAERTSGGTGKKVYVRVNLGGRSIRKKKNS